MTKRVILGALPGGTYGLRCSKPGYDVTTNPPDPTQMVFDSDWPSVLPVFYYTGIFGLANGAGQTFTYPTALSYKPFLTYLVSWSSSGPWYSILGYANYLTGSSSYKLLSVIATSTTLAFVNSTGATVYLFGYVFRQGF